MTGAAAVARGGGGERGAGRPSATPGLEALDLPDVANLHRTASGSIRSDRQSRRGWSTGNPPGRPFKIHGTLGPWERHHAGRQAPRIRDSIMWIPILTTATRPARPVAFTGWILEAIGLAGQIGRETRTTRDTFTAI